jgi:hypothetical protein
MFKTSIVAGLFLAATVLACSSSPEPESAEGNDEWIMIKSDTNPADEVKRQREARGPGGGIRPADIRITKVCQWDVFECTSLGGGWYACRCIA